MLTAPIDGLVIDSVTRALTEQRQSLLGRIHHVEAELHRMQDDLAKFDAMIHQFATAEREPEKILMF